MNGLDLFSGIGGMSLALRDYVRPLMYCEIDTYCQAVLFSRMADSCLPYAPIWDDIRTLSELPFSVHVDIIYGGFPCQNISVAGDGEGLAGERSGLFLEIMRLAKEIKPNFIFIENVPAITSRGGLQVVKEIASLGYDCRWLVISASSCGAIHKRERWFLLAHSRGNGLQEKGLASRSEKEESQSELYVEHKKQQDWPEDKSELLGVGDDVPYWVDRIKSLGNSVVPQQAKKAFEILMGIK